MQTEFRIGNAIDSLGEGEECLHCARGHLHPGQRKKSDQTNNFTTIKLHLPKGLLVAVMTAATAAISISKGNASESSEYIILEGETVSVSTCTEAGATNINVGGMLTGVSDTSLAGGSSVTGGGKVQVNAIWRINYPRSKTLPVLSRLFPVAKSTSDRTMRYCQILIKFRLIVEPILRGIPIHSLTISI